MKSAPSVATWPGSRLYERPYWSMKSPAGGVDVEHRGQVDVQPGPAQVRRGIRARQAGLRRRVRRLADLPFSEARSPREASHHPAFLVGHQQQRRPQRIAPARIGPLKLPGHRSQLGRTGDVPGEENDPGRLAPADGPQQGGRRRPPGVAVDHPLAGQPRITSRWMTEDTPAGGAGGSPHRATHRRAPTRPPPSPRPRPPPPPPPRYGSWPCEAGAACSRNPWRGAARDTRLWGWGPVWPPRAICGAQMSLSITRPGEAARGNLRFPLVVGEANRKVVRLANCEPSV